MKNVLFLTAAVLYYGVINGEETKMLCDECECTNEIDLLTVDCTNKNIEWAPQKLNEGLKKYNISEEHTLVLLLNDNHIPRLVPFFKLEINNVDVSFARCEMVEIDNKAFKGIKNIRYLNLGHNRLTSDSIRGDVFSGPFNINVYEPIELEILNLEHNSIHSLPRRMFIHLPNLKSLYLNNNPLGIIDSVSILALSSAKTLEVLDMSDTGISTIPDGIFKHMRHLKQLFLSGNKFVTVPETIGGLGNSLQLLNMNNNRFEELTDNSFLGLWRLDTLEIGDMRSLKRIKAGTFMQLKSLRKLFLCDNENLELIDREAFRELKNEWPIRELHLHNNNLHVLPADLAPWSNLTALTLDNNPWECGCETITDMTKHGLLEKLGDSAGAKCVAPIQVSGKELKGIQLEQVCSNKLPAFRLNGFASYARPSNFLISASVVVIILFVGVIIGMRVSRWRRSLVEYGTQPIRYTNMRNSM